MTDETGFGFGFGEVERSALSPPPTSRARVVAALTPTAWNLVPAEMVSHNLTQPPHSGTRLQERTLPSYRLWYLPSLQLQPCQDRPITSLQWKLHSLNLPGSSLEHAVSGSSSYSLQVFSIDVSLLSSRIVSQALPAIT